jgi:hypothetical protein
LVLARPGSRHFAVDGQIAASYCEIADDVVTFAHT